MSNSFNEFAKLHGSQLEALNIPPSLYGSLASQCRRSFGDDGDLLNRLEASVENLAESHEDHDEGRIIVLPHLCSWDMAKNPNDGMYNSLKGLPLSILGRLLDGLRAAEDPFSDVAGEVGSSEERHNAVVNGILRLAWPRVILYRDGDAVRGAIPCPPYPPQVQFDDESELSTKEADLVAPFPFVYKHQKSGGAIPCSLAYLSPEKTVPHGSLPTIDLVPPYTVPNSLTRCVRYAALLGPQKAPKFVTDQVKEIYGNFVRGLHLAAQKKLELDASEEGGVTEAGKAGPDRPPDSKGSSDDENKVVKVFTDANDPMELRHPEAGLTDRRFKITDSIDDADVIYSFHSLYAPGPLRDAVMARGDAVLINQFPYEGAFVQKDHLGREVQKQHGLPRPNWAIEAYDLDVQLGEFVGAAILAQVERLRARDERDVGGEGGAGDVLWIVKPARGTQSKGHVVTSSIAQILKMIDAGGGSRVAQRYIENPICYDGRKVDCRCIVAMTSASPSKPTIFMHNRVYFRIAGKKHCVSNPTDSIDHEAVLTAMHLVNDGKEQQGRETVSLLPVDYKTIAKLEADYKDVGFQWQDIILPKIQAMIRELFGGMTRAFPAMGESSISRALYGIDVMFDISDGGSVEPKLTEVTFCPSNNAVCNAYERDNTLYRSYNNDVFCCLFRGEVSKDFAQLL